MDEENITLDKTYYESSAFLNLRENAITSLTLSSEVHSTIFIIILKSISIFYYLEKVFYLPLCVLFGTINNLFILIVFLKSRKIYNKISRTALVYYVSLAVGDLGCVYFIPFLFFLGKNF